MTGVGRRALDDPPVVIWAKHVSQGPLCKSSPILAQMVHLLLPAGPSAWGIWRDGRSSHGIRLHRTLSVDPGGKYLLSGTMTSRPIVLLEHGEEHHKLPNEPLRMTVRAVILASSLGSPGHTLNLCLPHGDLALASVGELMLEAGFDLKMGLRIIAVFVEMAKQPALLVSFPSVVQIEHHPCDCPSSLFLGSPCSINHIHCCLWARLLWYGSKTDIYYSNLTFLGLGDQMGLLLFQNTLIHVAVRSPALWQHLPLSDLAFSQKCH